MLNKNLADVRISYGSFSKGKGRSSMQAGATK